MVSELSARLLGGMNNSSSMSSSGSRGKASTPPASADPSPRNGTVTDGSVGGGNSTMSGHKHEQETSPPDYIDLDQANKRRKISEDIYAASTVKEDLSRGGIAYPFVSLS